jgi:hypothetical protein
MQPLVVFKLKFCLVQLKEDKLYLYTSMKTFTDWTDFTASRWCSQAQILLIEKDFFKSCVCRRLTACLSKPDMTV